MGLDHGGREDAREGPEFIERSKTWVSDLGMTQVANGPEMIQRSQLADKASEVPQLHPNMPQKRPNA